MDTRRNSSSGRGRAGAGLRITRVPLLAAIRAAARMVARGVSSCRRSTLARAMRVRALPISAGDSRALAPPATAILFSPLRATKINATPET
jgi:hypothetical protein